MTRTQEQIVELIAQLTPAERREFIEHVRETGLEESFYLGMTPEQHAQLDEGIAQADRGEVTDGQQAFNRLSARFGFKRA